MTELAQGYLSLSVGLDHPGAEVGKWLNGQQKQFDRAGKQMGSALSKGVADGTERAKASTESARKAFDQAAKSATAAAEKRESADRKVQIAEAKLAETQQKYAKGSSQVLSAEDRLAMARKSAEKAALGVTAADKKREQAADKVKTATAAQAEAERRASTQSTTSAAQTERSAGRIRTAFSKLGAKLPNPFRSLPSDASRVGDQAGGTFSKGFSKSADSGMKRFSTGFKSSFLGNFAANAAGQAISAIGSGLKSGFDRLDTIDKANAKLTGLGNSAKTTQTIMDNALASVKGTAFGMGDAATVAATMTAAGIKPGQQLQKTLSLVADSATIAGSSMGDMGAIFSKVATSGKLQGDDLQQLGDRGIPIVSLLGKTMGKTSAEVYKMSSKGQIDFATFQKAMETGMGGAAKSSGDTFSGAMANAKAALGRLGASFMGGAFAKGPGAFKGLTEQIDKLGPVADKAGKILSTVLGKAIDGIKTGFDAVRDAVDKVKSSDAFQSIKGKIDNVRDAFDIAGKATSLDPKDTKGWNDLLDRFNNLPKALQGPTQALINFKQSFKDPNRENAATQGAAGVGAKAGAFARNAGDTFNTAKQALSLKPGDTKGWDQVFDKWSKLPKAGQGIVTKALSVKKTMQDAWQGIKRTATEFGQAFKDGFGQMTAAAGPGMKDAWQSIKDLFSSIGDVWKNSISPALSKSEPFWKKIGEIAKDKALDGIKDAFRLIGDALNVIGKTIGLVVDGFKLVLDFFKGLSGQGWGDFGKDFKKIGSDFTGILGGLGKIITDAFAGLAHQALDGFVKGGSEKINSIRDKVDHWFDSIVGWVKNKLGIHSPSTVFAGIGHWAIQGFLNGITGLFGSITSRLGGFFTGLGNSMKGWASGAWTKVKSAFGQGWTNVVNGLHGFGTKMSQFWTSAKATAGRIAGQLWGSVKGAFTSGWTTVRTGLAGFGTKVGQIWQTMKDRVSSISSSLWSGVRGVWDRGRSQVGSITTRISEGVRGTLTKMKTGVLHIWQTMKDGVGRIWQGLKEIAAKPIRFVLNTVINGGLIGGYNNLVSKLKLPKSMAVKAITWPKFQSGGYIDLPWSAQARDPYVGVTPGGGAFRFEGEEFITNRRATKQSRGALEAINSGALNDRMLGFAGGGFVGGRGRLTDLAAARVRAAAASLGWIFQLAQRGWNAANGLSGTSHAGDAVDVTGPGGGTNLWKIRDALRKQNWAAWVRGPKQNFSWHVHAVPGPGAGTPRGSAIYQWQDYLRGGAALRGVGSPDPYKVPGPGNWLSQAASSVAGMALTFGDWFKSSMGKALGKATDIKSWLSGKVSGALSGARDKVGGGVFFDAAAKVPGMAVSAIASKVQSAAEKVFGATSGPSGASGNMESWRALVQQALAKTGIGSGKSDEDKWLRQIMSESSGNPNLIQSSALRDINVLRGDPARGLVQVPGVTWTDFGKDMGPFLSNWMNPLKNLVVGMRAAFAQHGGARWRNVIGFGHGYAGGASFVPFDMLSPVGERGMELIAGPQVRALTRGSQVLSNADTRALLGGASGPMRVTGQLDITDDGKATLYGWMVDAIEDREDMNRRIGA